MWRKLYVYILTFCLICYNECQGNVFINKWVVEIDGGMDIADQVASDHGFLNLGQV